MARRAPSKEDRVLRQAQALLKIDAGSNAGARRLLRKRGEVLLILDLLAMQDHIEEACELGLLLEQALSHLGEPATPEAEGNGPGADRFHLVEHLVGIARAAGHPFYEGEMLLRQAELWTERGDGEQALALYAQVQVLAQGADLGLLEVAALAGQAELAQKEGNLFKAHGLYGKLRAQAAALGEVIFESRALSNLASTALAMGDFRRGARYAKERITLSEGLGDELGRAEALVSLGLAQRNVGEEESSKKSYCEALRLSLKLGQPGLEASVCYNFGCLLATEEPARAVALFEHTLRLARRIGATQLLDASARATQVLAARLSPPEFAAARREAAQQVRQLIEK